MVCVCVWLCVCDVLKGRRRYHIKGPCDVNILCQGREAVPYNGHLVCVCAECVCLYALSLHGRNDIPASDP